MNASGCGLWPLEPGRQGEHVMSTALPQVLAAISGAEHVLTGEAMQPFATDWRDLFHGRPLCVVRPCCTAEVSAIVQACRAQGVSVVPQGGNTGLAGGGVCDGSGGEVLLSLSRMRAIRSLDPAAMTVEAEAGAILQVVQEAAMHAGRSLPVRMASQGSATIGGIVSTNAGGSNVLRHGMTRDHVLGLEVVLADGRVLGARHLRKDNAGYDLKQLFIGAEGSLGIITAAVLRLSPRPADRQVALLAVADIEAAIALLRAAQDALGEVIEAAELISRQTMELVVSRFAKTCPVSGGEWFILLEFASSLPGLREAVEALLRTAFENGLALDGVLADSYAQADALWTLRELASEAEARTGKSIKHDVSVPLSVMPGFLAAAAAAVIRVAPGAILSVFGHMGDGNLHYNVVLPDGADPQKIMTAVHDCVAACDGSISAEHGLGQYRVDEWQRIADPLGVELCHRLKTALDPEGFMNPGKAIPAARAG